MGKKIPLLLSTLTLAASGLGGLVAPATHAAMVIPRDVSYWTFQEILDFEAEFDATATERCGEDGICRHEFLFEQIESQDDARYSWVEYFKNNHFTITDVDPAGETVTLYFRDRDSMNWGSGIDNISELTEVHLAWIEDGFADPRMDPLWADGRLITSYTADFRSGTIREGTHKVFSGTATEHGDGWFSSNVEHQYSTAGSDLLANDSHLIHFLVLSDTGYGDVLGAIEYDSCYKFGYDGTGTCQVAYSSDGEMLYLPSTLFASSPTDSDEDPNTTEDSSDNESGDASSDTAADSNNAGSSTATESSDTSSSVSADSSNTAPSITSSDATIVASNVKSSYASVSSATVAESLVSVANGEAPEPSTAPTSDQSQSSELSDTATPAPTTTYVEVPTASNHSCTEINFPWWIIALLVAGDALALWWFLPNHHKK